VPTGKPGTRSVPECHPEAEYQAKGMCKACYQLEYRKTHPFKRDNREHNARNRFGISGEEYNKRRESQKISGDLCGICKQPLPENTPAHLDHNHITGQIREFVHKECNMAIGLLQDSSEMCRLAAEYLEKHQETIDVHRN
jgi:hypothetical protein